MLWGAGRGRYFAVLGSIFLCVTTNLVTLEKSCTNLDCSPLCMACIPQNHIFVCVSAVLPFGMNQNKTFFFFFSGDGQSVRRRQWSSAPPQQKRQLRRLLIPAIVLLPYLPLCFLSPGICFDTLLFFSTSSFLIMQRCRVCFLLSF